MEQFPLRFLLSKDPAVTMVTAVELQIRVERTEYLQRSTEQPAEAARTLPTLLIRHGMSGKLGLESRRHSSVQLL